MPNKLDYRLNIQECLFGSREADLFGTSHRRSRVVDGFIKRKKKKKGVRLHPIGQLQVSPFASIIDRDELLHIMNNEGIICNKILRVF